MKISTSDKLIAYLTLISGLTISAVAVWYSVAGLVSIFAAAAVPIIVMGVALEVSKLIATVWLKMNWSRAPMLIRTYLIAAIAILMLITSMGIFGFLSKAHLDQNMVSGDVIDKVAIIDEKIKTQRDNIDAARKALIQMDAAVDQTMARSTSEQGADKAANLRRSQQRERTALQKDISTAQAAIAKLNEERAPMAKDLRAIEAEVGPIKYIAAFVYGSNPDANLLEKAVTWVIIIIVVVFDPLAVILLLASQYSFQWFRKEREDAESAAEESMEGDSPTSSESNDAPTVTTNDIPSTEESKNSSYSPSVPMGTQYLTKDDLNNIPVLENEELWSHRVIDEANNKIDEIEKEIDVESMIASVEQIQQEENSALNEWNRMIEEAEKAVEQEKDLDDHEILMAAAQTDKDAMHAWKLDNPDSSLKLQRKLYDQGVIKELPWEKYLQATADFSNEITHNEAAEEAAKWAQEQLEETKKKDNGMDGKNRKSTGQENPGRLAGYQQNAEQSERTIWQRIQDAKK
jgi:hypothetical protein